MRTGLMACAAIRILIIYYGHLLLRDLTRNHHGYRYLMNLHGHQ